MKQLFKLQLVLILLFTVKVAGAQDKPHVPREKKDPVFVNIQWDNDLIRTFSEKSDKYYTNGTKFSISGNFLKVLPTNYLLFKFKHPTSQLHHLRFGQEIYTPNDIFNPELLTNDRPYAGWLYGGHAVTSFDENNKRKLTSELQIGVTGPLSFAGEAQMQIHTLTKSEMPEGWDYQTSNNIGFNYRMEYEQALWSSKYMEVIPGVRTSLGTIQTFAEAGATIRLGLLNNYFRNNGEFDLNPGESRDKFRMFLSFRPMIGGMFYNSFLQGSMFGEEAPHTLSSNQVNHLYYGAQYGLNIQYDRVLLTVGETFMSPEFKGGEMTRFGSVSLRFRLN